jgi:hypothetical protein
MGWEVGVSNVPDKTIMVDQTISSFTSIDGSTHGKQTQTTTNKQSTALYV